MLQTTPFHPRTAAINQLQNWRRWSGYVTAGLYEMNHEREYWAIRNSAALIDVSPLMKYLIHGFDAARLLNRLVTRDALAMKIGQVMYTPWCNAEGNVLDDGTLARLDETTFRLTAAEPNLRWLEMNALGLDVAILDVSHSLAALSVQGPRSRAVLNACAASPLDGLKSFRLMQNTLGGVPVTISRTGYTGDLGYEIWMDAGDALTVWDALTEAGQAHSLTPAGMLALDVARIEAGLLLIDTDYTPAHHALIESQKSNPFELGLGWAVNFEKGEFVGRQALLAKAKQPPAWQFVGLEIEWNGLEALYRAAGLPPQISGVAVRASLPVYANGRQVGYASSSTWSPVLKKYIALAHLQAPFYAPGTALSMEVMVEHQRKQAPAKVVKTPFYEPAWKKG